MKSTNFNNSSFVFPSYVLSLFFSKKGTIMDYTLWWIIKILFTLCVVFILVFVVYQSYKSINIDDRNVDAALIAESIQYSPILLYKNSYTKQTSVGIIREEFFSNPEQLQKELEASLVLPKTTLGVHYAAINITVIPHPSSDYKTQSIYYDQTKYLEWNLLYSAGFSGALKGKGAYVLHTSYFPVSIAPSNTQGIMIVEVIIPVG